MPVPGQRGQAALDLLATIPALVAIGLVAWQLVAAAHVWLLADAAARDGARAAAAGADPARAARASLPSGHAGRARVEIERRPGRPPRVLVVLPPPAPWLPDIGPLAARAPVP